MYDQTLPPVIGRVLLSIAPTVPQEQMLPLYARDAEQQKTIHIQFKCFYPNTNLIGIVRVTVCIYPCLLHSGHIGLLAVLQKAIHTPASEPLHIYLECFSHLLQVCIQIPSVQ